MTASNPGLKPQYSNNFDASIEYYFEPIGQFTVGYFRKDIRDYITSEVSTVPAGFGLGAGVENALQVRWLRKRLNDVAGRAFFAVEDIGDGP